MHVVIGAQPANEIQPTKADEKYFEINIVLNYVDTYVLKRRSSFQGVEAGRFYIY
jgi:hypothetical protein